MDNRWQYAQGKHPAFCTCIQCVNSGPAKKSHRSRPSLSDVLDRWRKRNFDPHFVLGVPPNSSRKLVVEAHRRWLVAYHPDRHNNDPIANELTKHLNAARDELLAKGRHGSRSQRKKRRNQDEERAQREREAEELAQEAARIREEDQQRVVDEAEQLIRQAARRYEEDQQQREQEAKQRKSAEEEQLRARDTQRRRQDEERRQREQEAKQRKSAEEEQLRARDTQRRRQDEERRQRVNKAKQRNQERTARRNARKAAKRQRREEERRQRANNAEQQRRQEEARGQHIHEVEQLMQDAAREPRIRHSNYQSQLRSKRTGSLAWTMLAVTLSVIIVAYLVFTIEAPDAVDNMMQQWARLFDQALAR